MNDSTNIDQQANLLYFSGLLDKKVSLIERIEGGRNSKIYKITCDDTDEYIAKFYFQHNSDKRDRLGIEFSSMQFLWNNEIRCIPKPIVANKNHNCAIYEFVNGKKIESLSVTNDDIAKATDFLIKLEKLKTHTSGLVLPNASEACFSIENIVNNVEFRVKKLLEIQSNQTILFSEFSDFLNNNLKPACCKIIEWCKSRCVYNLIDYEAELQYKDKTLSPSDFGFHNTLKKNDDSIVFLDFEYFGWDDPAKMICDFILTPAMNLDKDKKQIFVTEILNYFNRYENLRERIKIVYPLFGLKFCCILLNEFIPGILARRTFASNRSFDISEMQKKQLIKSINMLQIVINEYKEFHYL